MLGQQVGCNLSSLELAQSGLGEVVDRLGDLGEFVLLAHGVDLVDGINMDEDQNTVYRENLFSVDFEENPMFAGVKQGSLFCDQDEFGEELDLSTAVDLTVFDPAVDHGVPFGLADAQLGVQADYFDFNGWLGFIEETHR